MNDNRINELVRMVMEVEEIERETPPALRLSGEGSFAKTRTRGWLYASVGVAAAAAVALVAAIPLRNAILPKSDSRTSITSTDGAGTDSEVPVYTKTLNLAQRPDFVIRVEDNAQVRTWLSAVRSQGYDARIVDPSEVQTCIVVAIYRDQIGAMHCVQLKPHEWQDNQCLTEVSSHELKSVHFGAPCTQDARQTLLVALSGPRNALPTTEQGAVALAKCILGKAGSCDSEPGCFTGVASHCLPSNVAVKIETVAANR